MRKKLSAEQLDDAAALKKAWNELKRSLNLTQEKAAHHMGWSSQGAVAQYLNAKIPLNTDAKMKFAQLLKVSPADIWPKFLAHTEARQNTYPESMAGLVPVISWVSAGVFRDSLSDFKVGDDVELLPCPANHSTKTFALRVVGDSMTAQYGAQRSYPDGTIIFVDPEREAMTGSRVIVKLACSSEVTFKQLAHDMGISYLKPLNPQYSTIQMPETAVICGVVIGSFMPE